MMLYFAGELCDNNCVERDVASPRLERVMPIKRRFEQNGLLTNFAAPVPPLGDTDLALVQRAMAEIAPDWAVELESTLRRRNDSGPGAGRW